MIPTKNPRDAWTHFLTAYQAEANSVADVIAGAWKTIEDQTASVDAAARKLQTAPVPADLSELSRQLDSVGEELVLTPATSWLRQSPPQACVIALQQFAAAARMGVRDLPAILSAGEALEAMSGGEELKSSQRRPESPYDLRAAVRAAIIRQHLDYSRSFEQLHSELVLSGLRLLRPRKVWTQALSGPRSMNDLAILEALNAWRQESRSAAQSTKTLAQQFCARLQFSADRLRQDLLRLLAIPPDRQISEDEDRLQKARLRLAAEQQTAGEFFHGVIQGLAVAKDATALTGEWLQNALEENRKLKEELESDLAWARETRSGEISDPPLNVTGSVTPAEQRAESWSAQMAAIAKARLGTSDASIPGNLRESTLRGRKTIYTLFVDALQEIKPDVANAFRDLASINSEIAQDLEIASGAISYARETCTEDDPQSQQIIAEAYSNSITLLEKRQAASSVDASMLEARLLFLLTQLLAEVQSRRERGQLGSLARSAAWGSHYVAGELRRSARRVVRATARSAVASFQQIRAALYRKIGLLPPYLEPTRAVDVRSNLGDVLELKLESTDLPALYRRIFRLAPVSDPKFLIGREEELAAIQMAHSRWMSGHQAIVLLVGTRGSGKTSLLNCALNPSLTNAPVYRLSFTERMRSWDQVQAFLSTNLSLTSKDLQRELRSERRIVVLEEFERTYLRVIGGFDSARRLLDLIEATAKTTMWILVVSRAALSLLEGSLNLRKRASVQVNAMALKEETLRKAILQRHNLSGLRLKFAVAPSIRKGAARLERLFGIARDPSDHFFEWLYVESQGIFRSAFELWQQSIEKIEAGTVVIKHPQRPDYEPLRSEIDLEDTFAIHALTQHGSLTPEELAEVLEMSVDRSAALLDRLWDMDLIELERERPGLRLHPEALRFIVGILRNRNLI